MVICSIILPHIYAADENNKKQSKPWQLGDIVSGATGQPPAKSTQFFRGSGSYGSGNTNNQNSNSNNQESSSEPRKHSPAWYAEQQRQEKSRVARQAHARKKDQGN